MSIKICVITPISHLKTFGSLGEMDMSLTHMIIENGGDNDYAKFYRRQSEQGRFILLDNSAYEMQKQGKGLDPDFVLDAAEVTKPREVIATDVLYDGEATVESTKRFIKCMKDRGVWGNYSVMGVVQGRTKEEWWKCLDEMMRLPVNVVGLSKLSVPMSFLGTITEEGCVARARLECTQLIESSGLAALNSIVDRKQIHLLGGDNWTVWEMTQQRKYPWIRSNDSSCAVWYGRHELTFNDEGKIGFLLKGTPDLENHDPETTEALNKVQVKSCIYENIAKWHLATKS